MLSWTLTFSLMCLKFYWELPCQTVHHGDELLTLHLLPLMPLFVELFAHCFFIILGQITFFLLSELKKVLELPNPNYHPYNKKKIG
jgi:hypothetical protein